MFWSKEDIVERLSKIPRTLEDISIDIFEGVPPSTDLVYKADLSKKQCIDASSGSGNPQTNLSVEQVSIEQELMYPYMDSSVSNEFAIQPAQYQFMLPYEVLDYNIRKEYKIIQPEELKTKFPVAYKQLMETKQNPETDENGLCSLSCYRLEDESFLQYLNTPKIIITNHYRLHASYDASGKHVFAEGIGVVLGDPTLYHYVTAVLNSSIARALPDIWSREKLQSNNHLNTKMLKRFPIKFPKNPVTETLISTICRYLIYLNRQKPASKNYSIPGYQNMIDFYKRIADLLILDTYITNDLDPKLIDILEESITAPEEEFEYGNDINILMGLQEIKKNILDSSNFRKCRFNNEFTNILATLKNNGDW